MMKIYNLTLLSHCLPPFERLKLTTYKMPHFVKGLFDNLQSVFLETIVFEHSAP